MKVYETELEVLGRPVCARIYHEYHKGSKGAREMGIPIEPDEADCVEIDHIMLEFDGVWVCAVASLEVYGDLAADIYDTYQ